MIVHLCRVQQTARDNHHAAQRNQIAVFVRVRQLVTFRRQLQSQHRALRHAENKRVFSTDFVKIHAIADIVDNDLRRGIVVFIHLRKLGVNGGRHVVGMKRQPVVLESVGNRKPLAGFFVAVHGFQSVGNVKHRVGHDRLQFAHEPRVRFARSAHAVQVDDQLFRFRPVQGHDNRAVQQRFTHLSSSALRPWRRRPRRRHGGRRFRFLRPSSFFRRAESSAESRRISCRPTLRLRTNRKPKRP